MKLDRDTIVTAVASFVENGGVITVGKGKRKLPNHLRYNGSTSARGKNKGQMGPNRTFNQGMKASSFWG